MVEDGRVFVRGSPGRALTFASIVRASLPTFQAPGAVEPDFEATTYQGVPTVTYASAVHVAVVDVDPETGRVQLLRYVVAHDCGRVINPMLVDGQIHGGVAQGVGGGLGEEIVYDSAGQLLTGSLMDYAVPRADELPFIETVHLEHLSPRNPLGVKGVGEGGAISPPAALANAIEDALAPFGVRITEGPVTAARIVALLRDADPDVERIGSSTRRGDRPRSGLDALQARLAAERDLDAEAHRARGLVVPEEIGVEAGASPAAQRTGRWPPRLGRGRRRSPATSGIGCE